MACEQVHVTSDEKYLQTWMSRHALKHWEAIDRCVSEPDSQCTTISVSQAVGFLKYPNFRNKLKLPKGHVREEHNPTRFSHIIDTINAETDDHLQRYLMALQMTNVFPRNERFRMVGRLTRHTIQKLLRLDFCGDVHADPWPGVRLFGRMSGYSKALNAYVIIRQMKKQYMGIENTETYISARKLCIKLQWRNPTNTGVVSGKWKRATQLYVHLNSCYPIVLVIASPLSNGIALTFQEIQNNPRYERVLMRKLQTLVSKRYNCV